MKTALRALTMFVTSCCLCVAGDTGVVLPDVEQTILSAVLRQSYRTSMNTNGTFVIKNTTDLMDLSWDANSSDFFRLLREAAKSKDEALRDAVEDLIRKNQTSTTIRVSHAILPRVTLIDGAAILRMNAGDPQRRFPDWRIFYQQYPNSGGLITISRAGISASGKVAIIYMAKQEQDVSGSGRLWILRKVKTDWVLQYESVGKAWAA